MMAARELPVLEEEGQVPEWIHLVPAGRIETFDGRGPYEVSDPQAVIEASFAARGEIEIDVNHSTFLAASKGGEAPARGWITEMQARQDGIWGKVRWTKEGARLVAEKAYRRISPVLGLPFEGSKQVTSIRNASLVNRQNLRGLTALNFEKEERMSFLEQLAALLGLDAGASEDQVTASIKKLKAGGEGATAAQSQLSEVATLLGLPAGGDVVAAVKAKASSTAPDVVALQSAISELTATVAAQSEQLTTMKGGQAKDKAEAFVDGEISKGRLVPKALRDHYVSMHQEDPARVEKEIAALPMLNGPSVAPFVQQDGGQISLNAEAVQAAKLLGLSTEEYQSVLDEERKAQGGF